MQGVEHNGHEKLTLLELVLQLHCEFRRHLEPIRVTPLQAGVLLYLHRHPDAKLREAAAAQGVQPPTLAVVIQDLVHKRWVTKRQPVQDRRAVSLRLSRRGNALALQIKQRVRQVNATLAKQDRSALGMLPKGRRF